MTVAVYSGWDIAKTGTITITVAEVMGVSTAMSFAVTMSTGTFCHRDLQAVMGADDYDDLAGDLEALLESRSTASGYGWGYTVSWSNTTLKYTIANGASKDNELNFTGAAGTRARQILGFSGNQSGAGTFTSDVRPYYVIAPSKGAISYRSGHQYFGDDWAYEFVADDGTTYGLSRTTAPVFFDCMIPFETKEQLWTDFVAASVPWTWQRLMQHAACHEPILIQDTVNSTARVGKLRPTSLAMRTGFRAAQYIGEMDLELNLRIFGSI